MENEEQQPQKLGGPQKPNKRQLAAEQYKVSRQRMADEKLVLQAQYRALADNVVILDIQAKIKKFMELHDKIAKDGEAYKQSGTDKDNQPVLNIVTLTQEERTRHLDKSAGITEIADYLESMLAPPTK